MFNRFSKTIDWEAALEEGATVDLYTEDKLVELQERTSRYVNDCDRFVFAGTREDDDQIRITMAGTLVDAAGMLLEILRDICGGDTDLINYLLSIICSAWLYEQGITL